MLDDDDFQEFQGFASPGKKKVLVAKSVSSVNGVKEGTPVRKDNKEKSRHDRERHREHEKDRDKDRKKGHKDKKYRDRDRDKKDRDKKGRGDGEKKERDKDRDKRDKGRDRDKHTREKDKSRNQNGKEEDRSEKRERERESKESTHDKDTTHNAEKRDGDEEEKENKSTPENNKYHPMTSSQSSLPSRPPKPRLTIDEKMFQRQLEEALILSRLENKGNSCEKDTKLDTETTHGEEVAVTSTVPDVSGTPETDSSPSLLNNYVPDMDTEETTKPPPHPHDEAVTTGANTTVVELNSDVLQTPLDDSDFGFGVLRIPDLSEDSDFEPTPKKKKKIGKEIKTLKKSKSPKTVPKSSPQTPDGRSNLNSPPTRVPPMKTSPLSVLSL
ncbi:SART-1 family protein DOT2-like [Homarus americanus]|uniref:SART-1 family protein DOT2-like n=1 Tax=Homarus americanus TaxID=6706 RepID=A0A8J5NAR5_HOMAM|nr:SART-1 family protein DOT2-like [Homarus americanus]